MDSAAVGGFDRNQQVLQRVGSSGVTLTAGLLVLLGACAADHRISLDELRAREQQVATTQPVVVQAQQLQLVDLQPYRVVVGDVLSITMYGLEEDRYKGTLLELRVHDDGRIVLPVVGPLKVSGLTLKEVEQAIQAAHIPQVVKDLAVYVRLTNTENTTVLVFGSVERAGMVTLRQNERNVLYAISSAGGFTAGNAPLVTLRPVRAEREPQTYNLADVNDVRRALTAPPLESGDLVFVESEMSGSVYVSGTVQAPGAIPVLPGGKLSVLRAIMSTGGIKPYINPKEATLVRTLTSGEQVHVKLDLEDMVEGKAEDVALRDGDILMVAQNFDTFAQEWFLQNVLAGPFQITVRYDPLAQYNANRAVESNRQGNTLVNSIQQQLASGIGNAFIPALPGQ